MKALIKSVKIIDESNCDVGFEIIDENGDLIISDTVNIRSVSKDSQNLEAHIKNVLTEIKNNYLKIKESKLSDQMSNMLHEEIELD